MQQQEYNVADTRSNKDNYQPMLLSSVLCGREAAQKQFCAHHRLPKSQTGLDVAKDAGRHPTFRIGAKIKLILVRKIGSTWPS